MYTTQKDLYNAPSLLVVEVKLAKGTLVLSNRDIYESNEVYNPFEPTIGG